MIENNHMFLNQSTFFCWVTFDLGLILSHQVFSVKCIDFFSRTRVLPRFQNCGPNSLTLAEVR